MRRQINANDQIDVRAILPQTRRPDMIVRRRAERVVRCGNGHHFGDHVPRAVYPAPLGEEKRLLEGDQDAIVDAMVGFAFAEGALESVPAPQRVLSTVLFAEVVGSTDLAGRLGDGARRDLLRRFHGLCRVQIEVFRGREIGTAGDGAFAIFDGSARAMRCADAMGRGLQATGITIRAGLHTGVVESLGDKVSGTAVPIGTRVMSMAGHGEVRVSGTARDRVAGSGIGFEDRGTPALTGVPGEWSLHRALVPAES